nr:reverse transcriptase/maturase family protein [Spongiibacter marinus]
MLSEGSYKPKPYYEFVVHEPKRRIIHAPAFRDTVVQHAVYRAVYEHFNKGFIDQSYACRKGMGTHKAADYCQSALRWSRPESVLLQMDVRKFFYSIDRDILRLLIERQIKDARLIELMMMYAKMPGEKGIPIGNLLSQLYALIYLNPLDHFIKREIKSRLYCRYVDDFVLFDLDRPRALESQVRIEGFLEAKLNLELSKWQIRSTSAGANFVGYRTWRSRRFIRKHSMYKFRAAARRGDLSAVVSILGHASKTASAAWLIKYLQEHNHDLYCQLPKVYRQ